MNAHATVVDELAGRLAAADPGHPLRVGVDGPCGSGKSTLARELVAALVGRGRTAVLLDSDGFHHVRAIRYRQGRASARGYYEDAYDFAALRDRVLVPLGPGEGSEGGEPREYATKIHDLATDEVVTDAVGRLPSAGILVFDCTFLQRGSLRDHWDEVIYLQVSRAAALARGVARDAEALGGPAAARAAYESRYLAAYDLYLAEEDPVGRAGIVLDIEDPERPRPLRWS